MRISSNIYLYLGLAVFLGFPYWRILRRTGLSPYFAAFVIVPLLGSLVIEAVIAFAPWPYAKTTPPEPEDIQ